MSRYIHQRQAQIAEIPRRGSCRAADPGLPLKDVLEKTAANYDVSVSSLANKRSGQLTRDVAAWLARRLPVAMLRELTEPFGLAHPASVRGLLNRAEAAMKQSPKVRNEVERLRRNLQAKK